MLQDFITVDQPKGSEVLLRATLSQIIICIPNIETLHSVDDANPALPITRNQPQFA